MAKVIIYAAETLVKFTNQILIVGFRNISVDAEQCPLESEPCPGGDTVIFQLHGAPQAKDDDKIIMGLVKQSLHDPKDARKKIIMIHRPDEIQGQPELKEILLNPVNPFGFVNCGENHINDDFFPSGNIVKKVIPHGFSSDVRDLPADGMPIVIGTHTTWGEMRSLEHALNVLGELFCQYKGDKPVFGYLGGKPTELLQIGTLEKQYGGLIDKYSIVLKDAQEYDANALPSEKNVVFIDQNNTQPPGIVLTFNMQMYYYGNKVRTGESSGTLHRAIAIPVILELNGNVEDLKLIKVPYGDVHDIDSIDFAAGAKRIADSIEDGSYRKMLGHNLRQAKVWDEAHIAREYMGLLDELK